jgi:glycosyltransferase involved in cell wall biosynthesis
VSGAHDAEGFPRPARRLGLLVDDDLMAAAYAASDLFVLPTLAENLPNAALEAMACGTPVLSFDVGGMPEAVRHLETGFLAPAGDATTLAGGIRQLLGDDELRERLGAASRDVAEREFASDLEARRFAELYAELVEERRNARGNGRR